MTLKAGLIGLLGLLAASSANADPYRGTGDMGLIIERANGSVLVVENTHNNIVGRIDKLGDLSHASVVYSRDARNAFVFGRDGGLTKIDLLRGHITRRIIQAGNSIGGAISQDGKLVAVSNYEPGGVKVFNSRSLELIADIPTHSKVVGLVDAPGNKFVFSLYDTGEIWVADMTDPAQPRINKFTNIGTQPYDGLITPDGRYYIAGLYGEDGMVLLDLWNVDAGPRRILDGYGRGEEALPVYKMPHLEGWAVAGRKAYIPAVGRHEVLVVDMTTWKEVGRIPVHGQPVFVMAQPDGRRVWVNFALPNNDTVQVIDTVNNAIVKTLKPGKGVLHMEFTGRGDQVWVSVRDDDRVRIYETLGMTEVRTFRAKRPSGIFFTWRAHRIGL